MIAAIPIRWSTHEDDHDNDSPTFDLSLLDDNALDQMDINEQTGSYTTNAMYDEEDSEDNVNENENRSSEDNFDSNNASESDQSIEDQQTLMDYNGENQSIESNAVEGRSIRGPIIVAITKKKSHPFHIYSYDKKKE